MKHYRIKVRDDKSGFFEELLRYLDFLDYEQVESFSEPRIYTNFELSARQDTKKTTEAPKGKSSRPKGTSRQESSAESLREILARIDQRRDESRKSK